MLRPSEVTSQLHLLSASARVQTTGQVIAELSATSGEAKSPPEWVRLLAVGANKARDGRGTFTVADTDQVVARTLEYKGNIDLLLDFEHQFDRAPNNGKPAPAAGWITSLSAKGPDGTPGIWAQVRWLPETVALIRGEKYRYLSAVVEVDEDKVVQRVPRASLTNHPALDTTTALFSAEPNAVVPLSVHQDVVGRLETLAAQQKTARIDEACKAGRLPPALRSWAEKLSPELLTEYLAAAPVIVTPGEIALHPSSHPKATPGEVTLETLSVEQKAEAKRFGVSEAAYCIALNTQSPRD